MTQPGTAAESDGGTAATAVDWAFFIFSGIGAAWFAVLLLEESLQLRHIWFLVVFWAALRTWCCRAWTGS